ADVNERALHEQEIARAQRPWRLQVELEGREPAMLAPAVLGGQPEGAEDVRVGGGEAMDVRGERGLAEDVDLGGLDRVPRGIEEALTAGGFGSGWLLVGRGPLDPPGRRRITLRRAQRPAGPAGPPAAPPAPLRPPAGRPRAARQH